jgi:acyl carrier protein
MNKKIFEIVARIMGVHVDAVSELSSPENLANWDSLQHMKLILALEESLSIQFTEAQIVSVRSVKDILKLIQTKA